MPDAQCSWSLEWLDMIAYSWGIVPLWGCESHNGSACSSVTFAILVSGAARTSMTEIWQQGCPEHRGLENPPPLIDSSGGWSGLYHPLHGLLVQKQWLLLPTLWNWETWFGFGLWIYFTLREKDVLNEVNLRMLKISTCLVSLRSLFVQTPVVAITLASSKLYLRQGCYY